MTGIVGLGRARRLALWVAVVFAGLPAGSALADTTIGKTGSNGAQCFNLFVGDTNYVVPSGGGKITSFSFESDGTNTGEQVDFLVLRQVSGSSYKVVGKSGLEPLAGTGLETFSASVSVQAGDVLGLYGGAALHNCLHSGNGVSVETVGADPAVGDTLDFSQTLANQDVNESANLVAPPSIAKAFSPTRVNVDGTSALTFTITNPNSTTTQTGVAFTDTLPSGLVVSTPNALSNTCGGSATATAGSGSISLTGGSIAASSNCKVVVNVTATTVGVKNNVSGNVSSTNAGTGNTASATLTVVDSDLALTNVPANMTVNATGPTGAVVSYAPPTATDEGGETPTVGCLPASGSLFPIAKTTVTCTATDADDSNSPVTATFTVTVNGALAQLQALLASVTALPSSTAKTVLSVQLGDAIAAENSSNTSRVCLDLFGLVRAAEQEESYGQLTAAQAAEVINAADQIAAVVGCGEVGPAPAILRPAAKPAVQHAAHKHHHGKTRSVR